METDGGAVSGGSLQQEISRREAFERKSAELESVNDELRLENGELRTQVQMLMKKLEEMAAKLKGDTGLSLATNTHEGHRKSIKDHSRRRSSMKKQSSLQVHSEGEDQETEVHTLRREKKELKNELEETKTKQLNFEAAFQTEFDLRTTMEEKYDSLRDRYERLVIESDELRRILRQHSILLPSPPTLRAKSRVITDGPMKPPRRKKRALSLQPEGRPKGELEASRSDKCLSQEVFPHGTQSGSTELLPSSPLQNSTRAKEQSPFLVTTELSTISGSTEITTKSSKGKSTEDTGSLTAKESEHKEDCSSGQPLQPTKTSAGNQKEDVKKPQSSPPSDHHKRSSSGGMMPPGSASQCTGPEKIDKSQESVQVTITVSAESETMNVLEQCPKQNSTDHETGLQTIAPDAHGSKVDRSEKEKAVHTASDSDREDGQKHLNSSAKEAVALKAEEKGTEKGTEWELDSLMASSAQQLESAKAFYAQMHAHLKEKQTSDYDSDENQDIK